MRISPGMQGLRSVIRHPALGLAEVAWRWTTAMVAWLLACYLFFEYLDSLTVTRGDLFLLRSGVPSLALGTIQRILLSGTPRFVVAATICLVALCVAWIFAASAGRTATIRALLDQATDAHTSDASNMLTTNSHLSAATPSKLISKAVVLLHCWRAALFLLAMCAFVGGAIAACYVASDRHPHPGIAFLLFLLLSWAIVLLWYALDWLLSTASIFAIRDRKSTWGATSEALKFACERSGAIIRTSAWFGAIHMVIFFVMTSLVSAPLALVRILPPGAVFLSTLAVTLLYFALIDFLRVGRLAAYLCIADGKSGFGSIAAGYYGDSTQPSPM